MPTELSISCIQTFLPSWSNNNNDVAYSLTLKVERKCTTTWHDPVRLAFASKLSLLLHLSEKFLLDVVVMTKFGYQHHGRYTGYIGSFSQTTRLNTQRVGSEASTEREG